MFLRAYQSLRRDDRDIDVRPWLFRVAHNRCIDVLRRPVGDALQDEETAGGAHSDPFATAIEQREAMRALLKDIGGLTDGQRSALLLRELGGLFRTRRSPRRSASRRRRRGCSSTAPGSR